MKTRSATFSRKEIARLLRRKPPDPELRQLLLEADLARPKWRSDCEGGPRPCPWTTCRYHLAFDVTSAGGLKENFPVGIVRERVRQIEEVALVKLRTGIKEGTAWDSKRCSDRHSSPPVTLKRAGGGDEPRH